MRLESAQRNREKLLRYILDNPGAVMYEIARVLPDLEKPRISQYLLRMENNREIQRMSGGISPTGARCSKWFALTRKTESARKVGRRLSRNFSERRPRELPEKVVVKPAERLFGGL
jgi:hypothetical protein